MLLSSYYSQGADLPVGWLDAFQNQHSALPLAGVRGFVSFVKALPVNTGAGLLRHASVCGGGVYQAEYRVCLAQSACVSTCTCLPLILECLGGSFCG